MTDRKTSSEVTRVVLADDHPLFREGVASLLERSGDSVLVGEAATGEEAVRLADEEMPDIVLMDLKMPGMDGTEATRRIVGRNPHIGVIILTMFEDEESVFAALKAGARGYVLKDADRGMLQEAIRAVARGEALLGPSVARRVLEQFAEVIPQEPEPPGSEPFGERESFEELTPRELEVLGLIARGLRNREIAGRLVISERTVGNHISNIFAKLQVADRAQAIVRARQAGLGDEAAKEGYDAPGWMRPVS
ncbi:MAG: response regulator transcription factor [Rubrobacteraceae bacterium]|nr:response regulator transcription factor [Rubrobacteraceae bacterium]